MGSRAPSLARSLIPRSQAVSDASDGYPALAIARTHACTHGRTLVRPCACTRVQTSRQSGRRQAVRQADEGGRGRTGRPRRTHMPHKHALTRAHPRSESTHATRRPNLPRGELVVVRCTRAHAYTIARVHARECEITRGDGRGQRLCATWVLGARRESESGTEGRTGGRVRGGSEGQAAAVAAGRGDGRGGSFSLGSGSVQRGKSVDRRRGGAREREREQTNERTRGFLASFALYASHAAVRCESRIAGFLLLGSHRRPRLNSVVPLALRLASPVVVPSCPHWYFCTNLLSIQTIDRAVPGTVT